MFISSCQESRKMLITLVKPNPVFKKKVRKRTISLKNVPLPDQGKYYIIWNISSPQILRRYFTNDNTGVIYILTKLMYSYISIKSMYCYFRFYFSQRGKNLATVCQSWGQELLTLCLCGLIQTKFARSQLLHYTVLYCILHWGSPLLPASTLKGRCHHILRFRFFSWLIFPQAPENNIRVVSNFFENSRRYFQVKVHHRYQRHHWKILPQVPPVLVDTSGKFAGWDDFFKIPCSMIWNV